jgi:hypothetical protein
MFHIHQSPYYQRCTFSILTTLLNNRQTMFCFLIVAKMFLLTILSFCHIMALSVSRLYSISDRVINEYGVVGWMRIDKENWSMWKTCPSVILCTTNPSWSGLGLNSSHSCEKLATNSPSCGTACLHHCIQPGCGAHPVLCFVATGIERMKHLECEADHSPSSAEVNKWLSLISATTLRLHGMVQDQVNIYILCVLSLIPIWEETRTLKCEY